MLAKRLYQPVIPTRQRHAQHQREQLLLRHTLRQ